MPTRFALGITIFCWASAFVGIRAALAGYSPTHLALLRYLIASLGIFPAALGYASWAYTLARIPAARAASFLYLVPAVTLGIAWTWLGEWPSWLALLGGAIAISGVVIVNLFGKIQSSVGANPRICSDRIFHILYLCWSSHRANFVYGENKLSSGSLRNNQSAANVRTRI